MVCRDCIAVGWTISLLSLCLAFSTSAVPYTDEQSGLAEGLPCQTKEGTSGQCKLLRKCPSQVKKIREQVGNYRPAKCGFKDAEPIVCCNEAVTHLPQISTRRSQQACSAFERDFNSSFVPYIISGEDTSPGEFPHMVALGYRRDEDNPGYDWSCGGSLISSEWVLTAAHCVVNTRGKPEVIWAGAYNLSHSYEGRIYRTIRDVVHPQYSFKANYFDVALLKVPSVKFDTGIYPACLYTKTDVPQVMVVTGWGEYDLNLPVKSEVLLKASLVPVPQDECNSSFASLSSISSKLSRGITADMLCARGATNFADTCLGDSGGPIQVPRIRSKLYDIVGITSFGVLCGGKGVYSRVESYLDWIESIVWPA